MSIYEIVGVTTGLASVVLTVRQNIWNWPVGIVSVIAFGMLFFQIKLYADMALQVFYVITGFIGWYMWKFGGAHHSALQVQKLTLKGRIILMALITPTVFVVGKLLAAFTDASLPFLDSLASALSVLAQLLMMRKLFESWVLWITVDVLSVGIYCFKGVYLTAGLYVLFLGLAIAGFVAWRRHLPVR